MSDPIRHTLFMIATLIRSITCRKARPLMVNEDSAGMGSLGQLKIALITDSMTTLSLAQECRIRQITPKNYQNVLKNWRPHFLFVESVFYGANNSWLYRVAKQPSYIQQIQSNTMEKVLAFAKDLHIPTLFWNKDDIPFFESFLHVAKQVDYVFTADSNFIPHYQSVVPNATKVNLLAMAYQSVFHAFTGFNFKEFSPCFLGSYYRGKFVKRQSFFEDIFTACEHNHLFLHIYDRHKNHLFHATHFRFPDRTCIQMHTPVPYTQTQELYKHYGISININSVTDSPTMLSRRFLEILACGGILVTNTGVAVQKKFSDYCHMVKSQEEATELLSRLKYGPSQEDKDRAEAGACYVAHKHTWKCRLEEIVDILNL